MTAGGKATATTATGSGQKSESRARTLRERLALFRENRAIAVLFFLFAAFFGLSLIANSDALLDFDLNVTRHVQRIEGGHPLIVLARALTYIGGAIPLIGLSIPALAWLWRTGRKKALLLFGAALLGGHPLNWVIKLLINRPRPDAELVHVWMPSSGTSFPSGHAMTAVMVFGFLAVLSSIHLPRRHTRHVWVSAFVLLAILVSLSRVYLGAHFLSDIIGGWAAGLFFLLLWTEAYKLLAPDELLPHKKSSSG